MWPVPAQNLGHDDRQVATKPGDDTGLPHRCLLSTTTSIPLSTITTSDVPGVFVLSGSAMTDFQFVLPDTSLLCTSSKASRGLLVSILRLRPLQSLQSAVPHWVSFRLRGDELWWPMGRFRVGGTLTAGTIRAKGRSVGRSSGLLMHATKPTRTNEHFTTTN